MNISSLTEKSKTLISDASNIAIQNRNAEITEFHMLDAMINNENNLIYQLLNNMGVNVEGLKENVEEEIRSLPKITGNVAMRFSAEVDEQLQESEKQSKNMKDEYISVEHIMLGIIEKCTPKLGKLFKLYRIDKHRFLVALKEIRGNVSVKTDTPENSYDVLSKFGKDVTEQARNNKLDPVIGRDDEIRNVMRILTRKTKNNPVLIGEPGVGKTAIVEGLAQRIVRGDVPTSLKNKHIYSLDLGLLIAGAKYKGEFEERLTSVMNELDKSEGNILLFIDEIHNLVGAGKSEGAMDASNLLKPKLSRGELHCMGATTLDEYREYIEKDPALARRFQPVMVNEPTVEDTITILRGIQEKFEIFHGVKIQDQAIIAAATLSNRYITDRFLPDKAIDLIDEACAMVRTEMESMPIELDEISRKIMQQEIEEAALEREDDESSKGQLAKVQKELAELRDKFTEMKAKWEQEKKNIARVKALKEQIDVVNAQIEQAERNYDLNKAAELKYSTLPNLKTVLEQEEKEAEKRQGGKSTLLRNKVTADEIQQIVSRWTGIPVTKMQEGERLKIMNLESTLHESVIGQDEAVKKVTECIIRSRAGIANPNRPIGSFLFLGPTGVGKTELAKSLAYEMFGSEDSIIRVDMSEYMESHSTSKLIGAPPGYVGYDDAGQLTDKVKRKPYSIILLDEIEKAHPDVFNILLQVLDDGKLTDSQGNTVSFSNTIIIMTSNAGSNTNTNSIGFGKQTIDKAKIIDRLKDVFRPEFLNRVDEIIGFDPLTKEQLLQIIDLMLKDTSKALAEKDIKMEITLDAKHYVLDKGTDIKFGARPLRRAIQRYIEDELSEMILKGELLDGQTVQIDFKNDKLKFEVK